MEDDAMDWNPTTPPAAHNPYSNPYYMPGGWPESPPPFRYTSGVFAKRRQINFAERATKKVCVGAWMLTSVTLNFPIRPVYGIVRDWKRGQQQSRGSPRRNRALLRSLPPQSREIIWAAEERERAQQALQSQTQSYQTVTPPQTPNRKELKRSTRREQNRQQEYFESPAATSVTDTETTIWSPVTPDHSPPKRITKKQTTSPKRSKSKVQEEIKRESIHYPALENPLVTTGNLQLPTPAPETSPEVKAMSGPNRFDAGYKRNLRAHSSRGLNSGYQLKPIGARIQDRDKANDFWGGWEHEKPINRAMSPTPSEQMQSELQSHVSHRLPENDTGPLSTSQTGVKPRDTSPEAKLQDDERWRSIPLLEAPHPNDYPEPIESKKDNKEEQPLKLFHDNQGIPKPPPPLRKTHAISTNPSVDTGKEFTAEAPNIDNDSKREEVDEQQGLDGVAEAHNEYTVSNEVESEPQPNNTYLGEKPVTIPVTPLKVVAEKPAEQNPEVPAGKAVRNSFETPAREFSKLKIAEQSDHDTPKATPHSGTKTTRITRYREALEKAQKAKLEQYELVPIPKEWDKKVRVAVRNGIPNYLGSHDLARLCPQYAEWGQDNWLNDETINKYLELVAAHGRKNDRPDQVRSHHTFNNFFYNNLRSKGPESVVRWAKKAKIGGTNLAYVEKIFVPINSGAHWTLAVVEPTQKRITHYNSMRGSGTGLRACEDLKQWVALEQGKAFKDEEWTLTAVGESPQQTNSDDCGVFTITSARQIMLGYTPMSYGPAQIPIQRIRIVAELINQGLLRSSDEE